MMAATLQPGITHNRQFTVTEAMAMSALGCRFLDSWALLGQLGDTCMASIAAHLAAGETTVGAMFCVRYLAPARTGERVDCSVTLSELSGRRLSFTIEARSQNRLLARGSHVRVLIAPAS